MKPLNLLLGAALACGLMFAQGADKAPAAKPADKAPAADDKAPMKKGAVEKKSGKSKGKPTDAPAPAAK